jgi:predicted MFS family arabinose efflux permease
MPAQLRPFDTLQGAKFLLTRMGLPEGSAFRWFFSGQTTSALGDGFVPVVFAFAALEVSKSGAALTAVLLALWLTRIATLPAAATFTERHNKVAVMIGSDIVRLLAQALVAVVFLAGIQQSWHLVASAGLYGAASSFFEPASYALMPRLVDKEKLQPANGFMNIAHNIGGVAGPALGALLVTAGGVGFALLVDCATFLVSVATLMVVARKLHTTGVSSEIYEETRDSGDDNEDADEKFRFIDALRLVARMPAVFGVLILFCLVQFTTGAIAVIGPIIAKDSLGGIGSWSILATAIAAGGLVGGVLATRVCVRNPIRLTILTFGTLTPLELAALGVPAPVLWLAAIFVTTTAITELAGTAFESWVQGNVPETYLARVGAVETGMLGAMTPLGIAVAVPASTLFGAGPMLMGFAVVITIAAAMIGIDARRRLRAPTLAG